jgi:hypothetical protein
LGEFGTFEPSDKADVYSEVDMWLMIEFGIALKERTSFSFHADIRLPLYCNWQWWHSTQGKY